MLRALLIFFGLAAVAMTGAWLADHPGLISMQWGDRRIETSTAVAATVLLVLLFAVAGLYRFWRWLVTSPMVLNNLRAEGRRRRGYRSLSSGLVAVAAGDAGEAKKLARRTAQLLDEPALTLLLSAQAAQLEGDTAAAKEHFQAMAEQPETEFLGLRGLLVQARRDGDRPGALALARRAFALRPDTPWVGQELFALEAAAGDWQAAEKTLAHTVKRKLLGADAAGRRQAIVLFSQALGAADIGESKRALELASKAHAQLPDFSPATALAGRLHGAAGDGRKGRRVLQAGWRTSPHPDLLSAWLDIHPTDMPEERLDAVQKLIVEMADNPESRMALARAALEAREYDQARTQLKSLLEQAPSARVARLAADLAEAERGDGAAARQWLRQAASLPADATWVCKDCGRQNNDWAAHCPDCGSFDAFVWRAPSGAGAVLPYAAGSFEEAVEPDTADTRAHVEILPPDVEPAPVPARD